MADIHHYGRHTKTEEINDLFKSIHLHGVAPIG